MTQQEQEAQLFWFLITHTKQHTSNFPVVRKAAMGAASTAHTCTL